MKIDRVTYQKIFPTGMAYLNHKIGVEIQLDYDINTCKHDDPDEAFKLAKATVEKWNLESNPGMAVAMEYMKPDFYSHRNGDIGESNEQVDKEFEELKAKLAGIEFYEDAKEYLDSTDFKHTMEAKIIINSKKRKV